MRFTSHCNRFVAGYCVGPLVGPLVASGRQILDHGLDDVPVLLQGAVFDGPAWLAGQPDYDPLRFPDAGAVNTLRAWGVDFVRLTLSADIWDQRCHEGYAASYPAPGYRADVRNAVRTLTAGGMYVVLNLYTSNPGCKLAAPATSGAVPLPGTDAVEFWKQVASEFAGNPLVGYEPWNEPEACATGPGAAEPLTDVPACSQAGLDGGWRDSRLMKTTSISYADVGMSKLYAIIHAAAPSRLVFLDANGWSAQPATYDALPATMRRSRTLVYALHPYDCQDRSAATNGTWAVAACQDETPEECATIARRNGYFDTDPRTGRRLSRPVVFDEIGFPEREQTYYAAGTVNGKAGYYPVKLYQRGIYLNNFIALAQARDEGFAVFTFLDSDTGRDWNGPYLLTRQPIAPGDVGPWPASADGAMLDRAGNGQQLRCRTPPPGYDTWADQSANPTPTATPASSPSPSGTPASSTPSPSATTAPTATPGASTTAAAATRPG
jgi:hypothetical protein